MKKLLISLFVSSIVLISPISYSSVLSDKISGTQTQSKTVQADPAAGKPSGQIPENPKEKAVKNPKVDEIMGFSASKVKLFFGIAVIIGIFIFGFGRYFLTGKQ